MDYVLKGLAATKGNWHIVAKRTGVPHGTIKSIGRGIVKNSRIDTVEALVRYFKKVGLNS